MTTASSEEIFGDFIELAEDREGESLSLRFAPGSTPLKQRWRNNGLSADFLAGYVETFFPADDSDHEARRRRLTVKGAVNYIANELLENAMKYSADHGGQTIAMRLHLDRDRILFHQTNAARPAQAAALRNFIARLNAVGPAEMLVEQMERGEGSGLGLLTMVNDYDALLAFRLVNGQPDGETLITTQVALNL